MVIKKIGYFKYNVYIAVFISFGTYIFISYYLNRRDFYALSLSYAILFLCYLCLLKSKWKFSYLVGISFLFRIAVLFGLPELSDDYFRFIWDGYLNYKGINPWLYTPEQYFSQLVSPSFMENYLYENMNSQTYFTIYPAVCQAIFSFCHIVLPENNTLWAFTFIMKIIIFIAEIGTLYYMIQLLKFLGLKKRNVFIYAFNPLVIIELTGNIHFEAFMIVFLLMTIYFGMKKKYFLSSLAMVLAIHVKLLPLMFIPIFIKFLGWKKGILWSLSVGLGVIILFLPFLNAQLIFNFFQSIDLYFQKFEFNASIYYLLRWLGFELIGYNLIAIIGLVLSSLTFFIILIISFKNKINSSNLINKLFWVFSVYFLMATVVHPWYLTGLLALAIFIPQNFLLSPVIAWTFFIILSYFTYRTPAYHENLYLTALEYISILFIGLLSYILSSKKINK